MKLFTSVLDAPIGTELIVTDHLQTYIPGLDKKEIVPGTKIKKLKEILNGCLIEVHGREVWLSEREAREILISYET